MTCLNDYLAINLDKSKVFHGSNLEVLPFMADNSVDAIVTDPPYELGFMGKAWDNSGIAYSVELWRECLRVLKPGGHLLAFGGSRTWHRLAVAIEDAGFEMRDSIAWLYGSGFPKSLDISKAIDKAAGVERETVIETVETIFGDIEIKKESTKPNTLARNTASGEKLKGDRLMGQTMGISTISETKPVTDDAKAWQGWGTALKPAFEPIVVARKPLIGTVAQNVLQWGTGGLNIDASRIGTTVETWPASRNYSAKEMSRPGSTQANDAETQLTGPAPAGRWPANIILDEYTAELLDEQSGVMKSGKPGIRTADGFNANAYNAGIGKKAGQANGEYGDTGGASRFFYVAKASKRDRNEGLEELKATSAAKNFHPTVKPTTLMTYLINLVTPPGGTVLDPFTGSGSTGKAAVLSGYNFIGIELTADYLPIIEGRLTHAEQQTAERLI